MIHHITDGDIPAVAAAVLSLGDGDSWVPAAPPDLDDLVAVEEEHYGRCGVDAADLPWAHSWALPQHAPDGAPTAADWQAVMEAVAGAAVTVACLPVCWLGEIMGTTSGWAAVAQHPTQSETEHVLAMAGEPAACACTRCQDAGETGAAVAYPPAGAICSWCGTPADTVCRTP